VFKLNRECKTRSEFKTYTHLLKIPSFFVVPEPTRPQRLPLPRHDASGQASSPQQQPGQPEPRQELPPHLSSSLQEQLRRQMKWEPRPPQQPRGASHHASAFQPHESL
jgi:hypothetical protein